MRRRRSTKTKLLTFGIFVLAFVLALAVVHLLPIPDEWERLVFFMLIPLLSFVGVIVNGKISNR